MTRLIDPLSIQVPIVDSNGNPTPQFMRVLSKLALSGSFTKDAAGNITVADGAITLAKMANLANAMIIARKTAGVGVPEACTITDIIDFITGTPARGDILYRGATAWQRLPAGTAGKVLQTNGAGADPAWASVGASTPSIRATKIQNATATASYPITWPTGTIAGDVVFIFAAEDNAWAALPAGWVTFSAPTGSFISGLCAAKIMTAADITAGGITMTAASGNGTIAQVTVIGTTMKSIRKPFTSVRTNTALGIGATIAITDDTANPTDLILAFCAVRSSSASTGTTAFSGGFTSLQATPAALQSGVLGQFTGNMQLAIAETAACTVASSGSFNCVVAIN